MNSPEGVVVVSFGSEAEAAILGSDVMDKMNTAFGQLKQKVLWKLRGIAYFNRFLGLRIFQPFKMILIVITMMTMTRILWSFHISLLQVCFNVFVICLSIPYIDILWDGVRDQIPLYAIFRF